MESIPLPIWSVGRETCWLELRAPVRPETFRNATVSSKKPYRGKKLKNAFWCIFSKLNVPSSLIPDKDREFFSAGLRVVLSQGGGPSEKVVGYLSCTLSEAEKKWSPNDLESWAIVWAVEKLKHYLWKNNL